MPLTPPDALRAAMAAIGPQWATDIRRHSAMVKAAYAPLLRAAPCAGVTIERDLAYGPHPRQVVDVFTPARRRADGGVVLYVHGGAFVRGDRRTTNEIYDNVLIWFARLGYLGINVGYRLAADAPYPGGAEDVSSATGWAATHAAGRGFDPRRIFLIGHSAGGTHVASLACDPALRAAAQHASAIVLVSARLRADQAPENPNAAGVRAYFGDDTGRYDERSPAAHAAHCAVPVMIAYAEFENPLLDVYSLEFAHRLAQARGRAPRVLPMPRHNHMSIVAHFNTNEEVLGRAIVDFFDTGG